MTENTQTGLPELEVKCEACDCRGGYEDQYGWIDCSVCKGAAFIATPDGQKILDLIRHNFHRLEQSVDSK
jgi:hypothetical protein